MDAFTLYEVKEEWQRDTGSPNTHLLVDIVIRIDGERVLDYHLSHLQFWYSSILSQADAYLLLRFGNLHRNEYYSAGDGLIHALYWQDTESNFRKGFRRLISLYFKKDKPLCL